MWMRVVSSWLCIGIYTWSLVAPVLRKYLFEIGLGLKTMNSFTDSDVLAFSLDLVCKQQFRTASATTEPRYRLFRCGMQTSHQRAVLLAKTESCFIVCGIADDYTSDAVFTMNDAYDNPNSQVRHSPPPPYSLSPAPPLHRCYLFDSISTLTNPHWPLRSLLRSIR